MIVLGNPVSKIASLLQMAKLAVLVLVVVVAIVPQSHSLKYEYVTWTSTVKLINVNSNARLHSHDVKYGSGSGQQSVTAVRSQDDHNSYWQLKSIPTQAPQHKRGEPIRCGDTVRLLHIATRRNLHSHLFPSPLSNNQEVSAFGENGEGDDGDNWVVECDDEYWSREEAVRFKHELTRKYLHVSGDSYGRPIPGQLEVSGYSYPNQNNLWRADQGVFIKPSEPLVTPAIEESAHVEL